MNENQGMSGWNGLQGMNPTDQAILGASSPDGQYAVDPSPETTGAQAGTPNLGALQGIGSLLYMLA